jgi:hypothetical protein
MMIVRAGNRPGFLLKAFGGWALSPNLTDWDCLDKNFLPFFRGYIGIRRFCNKVYNIIYYIIFARRQRSCLI